MNFPPPWLIGLTLATTKLAFLIPGIPDADLVRNPGFELGSSAPDAYSLTGAARWTEAGNRDEITSKGIAFPAAEGPEGSVSQMIRDLDQSRGRWLTFTFRGMAESGFFVSGDALEMKIDFYSENGTRYLDSAVRLIYREVLADRAALDVNGNHGRNGAAAWRSYGFEELLPFPEVDAVRISVSYGGGYAMNSHEQSFYLDDFSLTQHAESRTGRVDPSLETEEATAPSTVDESQLIALGGRWYYQPAPNEPVPRMANGKLIRPLTITEANAGRLLYKAADWSTPFARNLTAWLRPGHLDRQGREVRRDRFLPDSVTLIFKGDGFLTMKAKNIPNHPTARFPDTFGTQGYNPNHIQELDKTYRLPLEPELDPRAKAMDEENRNHALSGGSTGVAVNGVVFYNPFDAGNMDATSLMDRCCGHPSPDNRYHYHKYPICVNTPFVDKGSRHSGVLGFAFDGLPIYGPYESAGLMARDDLENPLNAFNAHFDEARGWHYHVTPGKFPYLIGGYLAKAEASNFERGPQRPPGGGPLPRLGPDGRPMPPPPRL